MFSHWDKRFANLAAAVAVWSKDPSTQVGAVITRPDKSVVSTGFNGFPRGCNDDPGLYDHRPTKYARVVHAELNAILTAREPLHGYTIHVTHFCCNECAKAIIQSGIARVVAPLPSGAMAERFEESFGHATIMLEEAGVEIELYGD